MEKKKVILDCDPGHDDAFAIMLAVQHLDVLGITTIGGNCTLENVTKNALKVLEVLGTDRYSRISRQFRSHGSASCNCSPVSR